jgi:hypothetical protein
VGLQTGHQILKERGPFLGEVPLANGGNHLPQTLSFR